MKSSDLNCKTCGAEYSNKRAFIIVSFILISLVMLIASISYYLKIKSDQKKIRVEIQLKADFEKRKLNAQNEKIIREKNAELDQLRLTLKAIQHELPNLDYEQAKIIAQSRKLTADENCPIDAIEKKWIDALRLASYTARIAIAMQVKDLQNIRNEFEKLEMPTACSIIFKQYYLKSMDLTIDGFFLFMQDSKLSDINSTEAANQYGNALKVRKFC